MERTDDDEESIDYASTLLGEEPQSPLLKVWKPSKNYKYELRDITEQYTPAEAYRQHLVSAGAEMRMKQRLEWKWKRNLILWTKASTSIKAGYRGMLGRRYFKTVQEDLRIKLLQRRCKEQSVNAFYANVTIMALKLIDDVPKMNRDLYLLQFKIYYKTEEYEQCKLKIVQYLSKRILRYYYIIKYLIMFIY